MAKLPAQWTAPDGSSIVTTTNASVVRILQNGIVRIEQDSTQRILNETVVTPKIPAVWDSL